ncbi:hypothetical protein HHX47_DHR1001576 [Lentinula edodes]|nr:hypothetical protein HHX47_DHR1001576 [Lentinula edodes]
MSSSSRPHSASSPPSGSRHAPLASSAATGNVNTVAGLQPIEGVQGLENVDVTDKIAGHNTVGFKVTEREFDEVEEPDFEGECVVLTPDEQSQSLSLLNNTNASTNLSPNPTRTPPPLLIRAPESASCSAEDSGAEEKGGGAEEERGGSSSSSSPSTTTTTITFSKLTPHHTTSTIPKTARFDFAANQSRVGGVGEQGWEDQGDDCQSVDDGG